MSGPDVYERRSRHIVIGIISAALLLAIVGVFYWSRGLAPQTGTASEAFRFGLAGFIDGARFGDAVRANTGLPFMLALYVGMVTATGLCFLLGRWLIRPIVQHLRERNQPPLGSPPGRGRLAAAIAFMMPPMPPERPGELPFIVRNGLVIAAFVHLVPPPGPWWLRIVLAVVLGTSAIAFHRYMLGAAIGCGLYLGFLWAAHQAGIALPARPDGLAGALVLAIPVILTVIVRSFLLLQRRIRA